MRVFFRTGRVVGRWLIWSTLCALFFIETAAARPPIRIASIYSMTGPAARTNRPSREGVMLAAARINDQGGILGRRLVVVEIDNRSTPIGAKVAADRAVEAGVSAILGCAWSSHTLAAARVAQENGIPMISNISTLPGLTDIGDCIFRVCYDDAFQGETMARFARNDLGAGRAVVLTDMTSDYGMNLARTFQTRFEAMGGRVLANIAYKYSQADFKMQVARVRGYDPEVIFIPGYDESVRIARALLDAGIQATPIGADGWHVDDFQRILGGIQRPSYYVTHWCASVPTPETKAYVSQRAGSGPILVAEPLAYDAVMLLADAIGRAGSDRPEKIRQALAQTRIFTGVTGTMTFDAGGNAVKGAVIMQVSGGRTEYFRAIGVPSDALGPAEVE